MTVTRCVMMAKLPRSLSISPLADRRGLSHNAADENGFGNTGVGPSPERPIDRCRAMGNGAAGAASPARPGLRAAPFGGSRPVAGLAASRFLDMPAGRYGNARSIAAVAR